MRKGYSQASTRASDHARRCRATYNVGVALIRLSEEGHPAGYDPAHVRVERRGSVHQRLARFVRVPHAAGHGTNRRPETRLAVSLAL